MELVIPDFIKNDTTQFSNSVANSGQQNIGEITWANAQNTTLTLTPDQTQEARDHFDGYGAWDDIQTMPSAEITALVVQEMASEYAEYSQFKAEYQALSEACTVSGRVFEADGETYCYFGS